MKKLDMRNKVCPYPVIETKKALKDMTENDTIEVLVDNEIATQNLEKLCTELSLNNFNIEKKSDSEYLVTIQKGEGSTKKQAENTVTNSYSNSIIAISSNGMGSGDEVLSRKLMEGFIYALTEQDPEILPKYIVFFNQGIFHTTINSKTVDDLLILQEKGVQILSCGLCLDFYNVKDSLQVGEVTNMYNISKLLLTHNTININ